MVRRIWYTSSLLLVGVLLLGACQPVEISAPTPQPMQPTLGAVQPGSAAAASKPDYPGIWGIWGDGTSKDTAGKLARVGK
jgi:hypothetical protein